MHILGCRLDALGVDEATQRIVAFARERAGAHVITLGTEMVVYAQRDVRFRTIVNQSALNVCDTIGLLKAANRRGASLRERVTGVELLEHLCSRAATEGLSVYLLGGAPGVADEAAAVLVARYPGLRIAGTHDGYFPDAQNDAIVETIRASGASILFVGLGSPRQEFFLSDYLARSGTGVGIGVGGSFDVISGRVERAPELWRRLNLEWLYRLFKEPKRWRRQLALPQFVWLVLREGNK